MKRWLAGAGAAGLLTVMGGATAPAVQAAPKPEAYYNAGRLCNHDGNGPECAFPDLKLGDRIRITTKSTPIADPNVQFVGQDNWCDGSKVTDTCPYKVRAYDRAMSGQGLFELLWTVSDIGNNYLCAGTEKHTRGTQQLNQQNCFEGDARGAAQPRQPGDEGAGHDRWVLMAWDGPYIIDVDATNASRNGKTLEYVCMFKTDKWMTLKPDILPDVSYCQMAQGKKS